MAKNKLFLLDAMALIYRAYFALNKNPRITSTGINTSAVLGFANTLLEILKKERPTHIGVAFDTFAPTARKLEYTDYKANREKMPEDIGIAIPYIQRLLEALNIPVLFAEGYEADDVIGTLSKRAEQEGFTVYMVTPDKDFGQLVSENIFMYKPPHGGNGAEILGPKEVCEKYGLQNPLQVIDMLGMWGDAADNIPGIPGVGEVTARKLIAQFGSMENMLGRTGEIKNEKLREKVRNNMAQALESKMLATIILNAPVEFNADELVLSAPDTAAVSALLEELEMRTLASRLLAFYSGLQPAAPQAVPIEETSAAEFDFDAEDDVLPIQQSGAETAAGPRPCICEEDDNRIVIWKNVREFVQGLIRLEEKAGYTGFYLHPSLLQGSPRVSGINYIALSDAENFYGYSPSGSGPYNFSEEEKAALARFLSSPGMQNKLCCYDWKTHLHLLWNEGIQAEPAVFDVMLAHYLIDPETGRTPEQLALNYTPYGYVPDNTGKDLFCNMDVRFCLQNAGLWRYLAGQFRPLLKECGGGKLFNEVEMPLTAVLCRMERCGVKVDTQRLSAYGKELNEEIKRVEEQIYSLCGTRFNIGSPKQLGEVLFDRLQITDKPKKTKNKQYSTAEDVLQKLINKHPAVEKVLRYRSLTKLVSTYIEALPALIDPKTGKVHTTFNQAVTATGRLSSQNPNLQNIPVRTDLGKEIRRCFVPDTPGNVLLAADYSQIELRIIAHLSGDETMMRDFSRHKDVHTATAANVFGVKPEEVTAEMRRKAKTVNFGIIYGISSFGLAERLQIARKEAADLIERYYTNYGRLKAYMEKCVEDARQNGYVETMMHRRRYLKNINSGNAVVRSFDERNAVNAPVQGSSADMIKAAMIAIDRRLREEKMESRMILQVHDELVFNASEQEVERLRAIVVEEMKNALPMRVPVEVEASSADNWLDAH